MATVISTREPVVLNLSRDEWERERSKSALIMGSSEPSASLMYVPLRVGTRVRGVMSVQSYQFDAYGAPQLGLLTAAANYVSSALETNRLFTQTQDALAETQNLYEISARLNASNTVQEVLEAAAGPAIVQGATRAALLRVHTDATGEPNELEFFALWPRNSEAPVAIGTRFSSEALIGDSSWAVNPFEPVLIENTAGDIRLERADTELYEKSGVQASALLPLKIGERWIGLMTFNWDAPRAFSPRDVRMFRAVMAQAATVLDNRSLFEATQNALAQVRQQNAYLTALHDTTLGLMRRLDVDELLQNIIARAGELVGTEHGYVHLVEPGQEELRMRVGIGIYQDFVGTRVKAGQGLAGTVWREQTPIVVDDYRQWEGRLPMVDRDVLRAVVGVPLKSQNQTVGVLGLASLEEGWRFGSAQIEALNRFAELAAVALDNAQLYNASRQALEKTQRLAQRERASAEIADKLYAAPDVKAVLRTAAEELRKNTGSRRTVVRLNLGKHGDSISDALDGNGQY
jgi:GAF domain-containing protein